MTLAHAGARVVALVTEYERQQSYAAFRLGAALRWRVPVWTSDRRSRRVAGRGRLAGVEVTDVRTGAARFVPCEIVVFTGDWIPDHELARLAGLAMDPGTRGPVVDTRLETSAPGVFAAGNLVHAAETADIAALSGRHAARHIAAALGAGAPDTGGPGAGRQGAGPGAGRLGAGLAGRVPVRVEPPLRWISPNAIASARPSPAGPVRAAQPGVPRAGPARGAAGRAAAGPVTPGPAGAGAACAPRRRLAGPGRPGGRSGARHDRFWPGWP